MTEYTSQKDSVYFQAIMFADVSGSSALYKAEGNVKAKGQIDSTILAMRTITEQHTGIVVKTIGDEIMARFHSAADACRAAMQIQQHCVQQAQDADGLAIRIGMDFGHTLLDGDDVFGDTVNDAACVAHIARPNQIVITQALVDALPASLREKCQEFDRINLKGEMVKSLIYRLVWENPRDAHHATTVMSINHVTQKISTKQIQLDFNQQIFLITSNDVPFVIGRDHRIVHLHIDSSLASRDHCHIVLQRGKFMLRDHSTNGTYVTTPDQPEIYLRREEIPLQGEGTISIGRRAHQAQELTIHYKV